MEGREMFLAAELETESDCEGNEAEECIGKLNSRFLL